MSEDRRAPSATPRPFKCTNCNKGFTRQENLKRHVNTRGLIQNPGISLLSRNADHKGFSARSFHCTLCNARFARSDLRKRHIENCHVQSQTSPKATTKPNAQLLIPQAPESPLSTAWLETLNGMPPPVEPVIHPVSQFQEHDSPISVQLRCIESFFNSFHKTFPVLHEGSFQIITAPAPLINVITCIGSLYCQSTYTDMSRKTFFESTLASMQHYAEQNRSRYQETWVMQTFLLLEFLGIYGGDDGSFLKAQRIHRDLVDAMRMLQMSHDGAASYSFQDSDDEMEDDVEENLDADTQTSLDVRWQAFVVQESRKRCIYTLYLLDSQLSILCNLRPMLSSLEIKYDLPCCEEAWLSKTAEAWHTSQKQQFKSFDHPDDQSYPHDTSPAQGFFYAASQTLLHSEREKRAHPAKLRLLWASPFAAVILVTQLQMMARELTHASCLLERPKAQRRTLSVLSEKQHAQISQALRRIAELVPRNQRPAFNFFDCLARPQSAPDVQADQPLWHTFWVLWYYTSITLSHPDSLLVSGVVESNLPLAIATAGHLATPRSKDKRDIYEDRDVFRILNDLELALEILNPAKSTSPPTLESPFITLLGFKACLVGWRLVRLTMGEASEAARNGARSNPCKFVLDAIMTCIDVGEPRMLDGHGEHEAPKDAAASEVEFLGWIVETFKRRTSWPVGKWVAAVMEEALAKAKDALTTATPGGSHAS